MSRSGYSDDCNNWDLIRWRGAVTSAIRGERGQALLRELAAAMDAMPIKELVAEEFQADGQFCALGVVGAARGLNLSALDPEDRETVAGTFGVATALAAEIMDVNDNSGTFYGRWERYYDKSEETERRDREKRWREVRTWVAENIKATGSESC